MDQKSGVYHLITLYNKKIYNKRGLRIHAARCEWSDEFEIEGLQGHRGHTTSDQQIPTTTTTFMFPHYFSTDGQQINP